MVEVIHIDVIVVITTTITTIRTVFVINSCSSNIDCSYSTRRCWQNSCNSNRNVSVNSCWVNNSTEYVLCIIASFPRRSNVAADQSVVYTLYSLSIYLSLCTVKCQTWEVCRVMEWCAFSCAFYALVCLPSETHLQRAHRVCRIRPRPAHADRPGCQMKNNNNNMSLTNLLPTPTPPPPPPSCATQKRPRWYLKRAHVCLRKKNCARNCRPLIRFNEMIPASSLQRVVSP